MRISTGIDGLDQILHGGLIPARVYLVHGEPGTGKTALGLHFLAADSRSLLITLGQAEDHIRSDAHTLGLGLEGVSILDLTPSPEKFSEMQTYDIFSPAEVEHEPLTREISNAIEHSNPKRIFVDSFGQFRQLASDPFHYRRVIQSFFRFATQRGATLMIASDERESERDVDGVIHLDFEHEGRSVRLTKFRGSDFHAGRHSMRITAQGLQVLPNAA